MVEDFAKKIILLTEDDYRDKIHRIKINLLFNVCDRRVDVLLAKKKFWSSLAKPKTTNGNTSYVKIHEKCTYSSQSTVAQPIKSSTISKAFRNNSAQQYLTNHDRLRELSQPKFSYNYTERVYARKRFSGPKEFGSHLDRLNELAAPRKTSVTSCSTCCYYKVPLSKLTSRIERLSAPIKRDDSVNVKPDEESYSVKRSSLKFVPTERIKRLATPRSLHPSTIEDLEYDPNAKLKSALKYTPSSRILELAKPSTCKSENEILPSKNTKLSKISNSKKSIL